mgnify:FL=1
MFCLLFAASATHAAEVVTAPDGAKVYAQACQKCHNGGPGGFFTGAPKTGSKDWKARVAKAPSTEALHAAVRNGKGKMPPQGGGEFKLTDADLRAATDYMLSR